MSNDTPVEQTTSVVTPEGWTDQSGAIIVNETDIPDADIFRALHAQHPEYRQLANWAGQTTSRRQGGIFDRDRYITPQKIFEQFRLALHAAENDDVVSGVLESTEALAFSKMSISSEDEDDENIWNQIAADLDMDGRLREMWRELFTVSQFYAVTWWQRKEFKVKGKSEKGVRRKKPYNIEVPVGITLLDPLKVVPVGDFMFGQERLAYIASRDQAVQFDAVLAGENTSDLMVLELIQQKYEPSRDEKKSLAELTGQNVDNLYILNPDRVWRHTATRPHYQRFATCRMKSVFELLDLKNQLREMDRAHLIGGTNFIILVKKGSDDLPAKQGEVQSLAAQVRASSRVPVIIGDHRIEIDIITPKQDQTLKPERYNTLDARVTARLYQMFMTGNYAAGAKGDDSIKLARVVARGLESRRHMMRRSIEKYIFNQCYERNKEIFKSEPKLKFHPKRIALDFDSNVATYLQDLRDRGDISRETMLQELDLSQYEEARQREREEEHYDDIFTPVNVPFSTPIGDPRMQPNGDQPAAPKNPPGNTRQAGRRGGTKGGSNPASSQPNSQRQKATEGDEE